MSDITRLRDSLAYELSSAPAPTPSRMRLVALAGGVALVLAWAAHAASQASQASHVPDDDDDDPLFQSFATMRTRRLGR